MSENNDQLIDNNTIENIVNNIDVDENKQNSEIDVEELKNDKNACEHKIVATKQNTVEYFGHKEDENIWDSFLTNKMFAHRGLYDKESPENSLSAFEKAIKNGYAIELDVNPIEDGTPVVFHDSKMSRMTGKDKYIQNLTQEELATTTFLNSEEKIPTLKEVLEFVDGRTPLLVEIKHQQLGGDLEKRVWELLKNYKGEYAVQSFDPFTLQWFYKNAPKVWRGQLSSFFKDNSMGFLKRSLLKRFAFAKITHHDFVSYDISNLPNRFVKKQEVPVLTWTIDKQEKYIKAIQVADNVIFEGFEPKI